MVYPLTRRRPTRGGVRPVKRMFFYCQEAGHIQDDYECEDPCPICAGSGKIACVDG